MGQIEYTYIRSENRSAVMIPVRTKDEALVLYNIFDKQFPGRYSKDYNTRILYNDFDYEYLVFRDDRMIMFLQSTRTLGYSIYQSGFQHYGDFVFKYKEPSNTNFDSLIRSLDKLEKKLDD